MFYLAIQFQRSQSFWLHLYIFYGLSESFGYCFKTPGQYIVIKLRTDKLLNEL